MKKEIGSLNELVSVARWRIVKAVLIVPLIMSILPFFGSLLKLVSMFVLVTDIGSGDPKEMANLISIELVNLVEGYVFDVLYFMIFLVPVHIFLARLNRRDRFAYGGMGAIGAMLQLVVYLAVEFAMDLGTLIEDLFLIVAVVGIIQSTLFWLFIRKLPKRSKFVADES